MIQIQYSVTYTSGYSEGEQIRGVASIDTYRKEILNVTMERFFIVNSIIHSTGWWLWKRDTHVLLLDCDGTGEMLAACNMLKATLNTGYALIQSSPSKYWIVVDKVGEFLSLVEFANQIPGVDPKFVQKALEFGRFFLRATPLGGKQALFEDPSGLTNPLVRDWYLEFEKLWRLPEVGQRYRAEVLKAQVADGSILGAAADPTFQL